MTAVPANAKKPADRKAPAAKDDATGPADLTVEWGGHEYFVPGEAFDDVEFLDAMIDAETKGDDVAAYRAARSLLGEDVWNEFRANARGANGRVKTTDFMDLFKTVMEAAGRKNS
jgi:hypothetical protein